MHRTIKLLCGICESKYKIKLEANLGFLNPRFEILGMFFWLYRGMASPWLPWTTCAAPDWACCSLRQNQASAWVPYCTDLQPFPIFHRPMICTPQPLWLMGFVVALACTHIASPLRLGLASRTKDQGPSFHWASPYASPQANVSWACPRATPPKPVAYNHHELLSCSQLEALFWAMPFTQGTQPKPKLFLGLYFRSNNII